MKYSSFLLFLLLLVACQSNTQKQETPSTFIPTPVKADNAIDRFEPEIIAFEKEDFVSPFMKGEILFTGSSSIRMWKNLKTDLAGFPVHNRGFGGSTIPEVMHYADRIVFKYRPKLIVLYCGENDISDGATADEVFNSFKIFVEMLEERLPETKLAYLAMKPSVARWKLWPEYQKGNKLIEDYTKTKTHLDYIAVDKPMLDTEGMVDATIFIKDMLHMNEKGYALWTALVNDYLKK